VTGEDNQTFVAAIAAKYGKRLRRFLSVRLRNSADAPDLAQEVYLRLLRVDRREAIRSPEAYLFTVASHVLHQHAVLQAAVPPVLDISEVFAELQSLSEEGPEAQAALQQRLDDLERMIRRLPAREASALLLHRFAGYSIEEIGRELGVARITAAKYLAKALAHCRTADDTQSKDAS
jgi:RNA polymerase sigma factor (sigma-70 family)